ncbi:TraC family protein [Thiomicrorhabdus hydrogeniphila]
MVNTLVEQAKEKGAEVLDSLKIVLGIDDDLKTRKEYKKSLNTDSINSLLPYLGWEPTSELFILDSGDVINPKSKEIKESSKGYLGFTLECNPQTGANDSMESIMQSLYLQAPPGSSVSTHLYASPDILPTLKASARKRYSDTQLGIKKEPHEKRNKNIYQAVARRSTDYLLHGTYKPLFENGNNFLIRDFRLVVSVVTPYSVKNESNIEKTLLIREQIKSTLNSAGFPSFMWKPADLINFMSDFLDHSRVFHVPSKVYKEYNSNEKIRRQISSREQEYHVKTDCIQIDNSMSKESTCLAQLSVAQFPKHFHLAEMTSLVGDFFQSSLAYPCPFMITTSAVVQDYDSMRNKATLKTATAVRKSEGYMAKLDSRLADEAQEWKYALSSIEDGGTLIKLSTTLTLITKKKDMAKAKSDAMAIWRSKGFRLADDKYQQLVSFLSCVPMSLTKPMISDLDKMHRLSTKYSQNAVSLAPCIAEWKGTETPTMTFVGRRGQLVSLDFFDNEAGNFNFAIVGSSGSGKTFITQEVLLSYRAVGAKIWVIDVGRGYENICKMIDGEFVEFTEESAIIINPFSHIQDLDDEMDMLKPLICQMMSPDHELSAWEKSTIEQAITFVYKKHGNKMTVTELAEYLLSDEGGSDKRKKDLGVMLFPWTRDGAYGKYFDGEANITFQNDFTVLELEELKSKKALQAVVLMIMMYRISQEMYLTRDRKKVVLIDEAWSLMTGGGTEEFIENGYRRARRYGGCFGTATQNYDDYKGGAAAALQNADWTLTLRQKDESIVAMEQKNILNIANDPFRKRVINDLKMIKGQYSEVFINYPDGAGVVRFVADPFKQILFSSKHDHFKSVTGYKKQGYDVISAVEMTMKDFGLPIVQPIKYE